MPSIVDVIDILERLESKALHVNAATCAKVRNRNSVCKRCANACPSGAISLNGNTIDIDSSLCISCGSCAVACPTDAITHLKPADKDLYRKIRDCIRDCQGHVVFICARVKSHHRANVDMVVSLPCVSRIDATMLVYAAAQGASAITIVDGGCDTCKYKGAIGGFQDVVNDARGLLAAWGSLVQIQVTQEVPEMVRATNVEESRGGVSRRAFFTNAKDSAKKTAVEAVNVTVEKELGLKSSAPTLRDLIRVGADGYMPHAPAPRHDLLVESLFELGEPVDEVTLTTKLWGNVVIDTDLCKTCGVCATFCSTGALQKIIEEPSEKELKRNKHARAKVVGVEFRLSDCVQCRLCQDGCFRKALTVSDQIDVNRILDLEPVAFYGQPPKK